MIFHMKPWVLIYIKQHSMIFSIIFPQHTKKTKSFVPKEKQERLSHCLNIYQA